MPQDAHPDRNPVNEESLIQWMLEVESGRTRFPIRRIHGQRFLIGASPECDLQIGGDGIPPIHSVLLAGEELEAEALDENEHLFVNGVASDHALLAPGDQVEIGSVQFVVRRYAIAAELAAPVEDQDLSALSAEQLIEHLDHDMTEIDRYISRREAGVEALVHAMAKVGEADAGSDERIDSNIIPLNSAMSTVTPDELLPLSLDTTAGFADLAEFLDTVATELSDRAERIAERESQLTSTSEELVRQQVELASQVDRLIDQIGERQSAELHRRSA